MKAPWYKRYPGDFVSNPYVQAMTAEQYGWFSAMLDAAWLHTPQGYLPNDKQLLSRMVGRCNEMYFAQHAQIVWDRFQTTPDGLFLYHPKMIEQVEKISQVSEKRSEVGKRGADKRWSSNCHNSAKQLPTDSDSDSDKEKHITKHSFELPVWIPEENWKQYDLMRRKIGAPLTDRAKTIAVNNLEKLMNQGHEPGAVLDQSVFNSWKGLFAIHGERRNGGESKQQVSKLDQLRALRQAARENGSELADVSRGPQTGAPQGGRIPEVV